VAWSVKVTEEYAAWFTTLIKDDLASATQVAQAVAALREEGPTLGRPLVDRIQGSRIHHLKELRPGSGGRSEIRVLFAFDPARAALLLLANFLLLILPFRFRLQLKGRRREYSLLRPPLSLLIDERKH